MPFVSKPHAARFNVSTHSSFGYDPESRDELVVPYTDRFAGTYILGVPGSGKSALLQNLIAQDMLAGHAVIVTDAHGDLVRDCLSFIPDKRLNQTYLLDMEDEDFPVGVNVFTTHKLSNDMERAEAVERIQHIFEVLWPEVASQQYLPMLLPSTIQVFLDNPGKTLFDMLRFFRDDAFRASMLQHVTDPGLRDFWEFEYNRRGDAERRQRAGPLVNRLHTLFTGHSLVRNILGQPRTTINFRKAIEAKQVIFIKLPTTRVRHVARLIGTILLAQIQAAVFSFAELPANKRPGVSLYMDEFQEFATGDIELLISQGRKFGMRLTIAHQHRDQLPGFLHKPTMSAYTHVCFKLEPDDSREMAHLFPSGAATVQPEDIEVHPTHWLINHPSDDLAVRTLTEHYLHPLLGHRRGAGSIEIELWKHSGPNLYGLFSSDYSNPRVADPTHRLDSLLYEVMATGNPDLAILPEIPEGFSNCGLGFYNAAKRLGYNSPCLLPGFVFPAHLVGSGRWLRTPEGATEQLYHFLYHLRAVMYLLAEQPIGRATTTSTTEVARMLTQLPRRAAFVRSADTMGVIYTHTTPERLSDELLYARKTGIMEQTHQTYCYPKQEVEQWFIPAQAEVTVAAQPLQAEIIE